MQSGDEESEEEEEDDDDDDEEEKRKRKKEERLIDWLADDLIWWIGLDGGGGVRLKPQNTRLLRSLAQ
ncbi:hypothetical protein TWF718_006708 [Orbilia javanica]|uniref:Uncharacterized protein n=1 Tax=Orbilia javanica TaxID=47235 RepID=A0AAN8MXE7_9PEZI